jgi:hypothetical protein
MNTRAVILVATGIAIGSSGAYVAGTGLSQAAIATTQPVSQTVDIPTFGGNEDYPNLSQRAILNKWIKKNLMTPIETAYGITPGTLSPCTTSARISIVYTPVPEDPAWCTVGASAQIQLPGEFVAGAVSGGQ